MKFSKEHDYNNFVEAMKEEFETCPERPILIYCSIFGFRLKSALSGYSEDNIPLGPFERQQLNKKLYNKLVKEVSELPIDDTYGQPSWSPMYDY